MTQRLPPDRQPTAGRRRHTWLLCLLIWPSTLAAQPDPPAPREHSVEDPATGDPRLEYSDARALRLTQDGTDIVVEVRMARPIREGHYLCVHVYGDCDDNPATGVRDSGNLVGNELWVRAAVGSRFLPNTLAVAGGTAPLDLRRASYSQMDRDETPGRGSAAIWLHRGILPPPTVENDTIRFRFPRQLALTHKSDYHSRVAFRIDVETSSCDQPLLVETACDDEGLNITLDGDDGEWTGSPFQRDAGSELHSVARFLDLLNFRLDHGAGRLFGAVRFDQPGFTEAFGTGDDVLRRDALLVQIEPMNGGYGPPRTLRFEPGRERGTVGDAQFVVAGTGLEFSVPRGPGETRFRALASARAERWDFIPNEGRLRMDLR